MGTLIDLFSVLEGLDKFGFPEQVTFNPDPAIRMATLALRDLADPEAALVQLEDQIKLARMLMRSLRFNVVENVASERGWSPQKIFSQGSELHRLSALLYVRLQQRDAARAHLLLAIACRPDDPNLAFHLVDVYCEERRYGDGFALLDRTFETFAPGRPDQLLGLYRLTLDAHTAGAFADARQLYDLILRRSGVGVFAELATRQLHHIDAGANTPPTLDVLGTLYKQGINKQRAGDFEGALSSFYDILAWKPDHEASWFLIGEIFTLGLSRGARSETSEDVIRVKIRTDIDNARRSELFNAVQALRIASSFDDDPKVATESHRLLTACYLELAEPMQAVQSATVLTEKDPDRAMSWGTLSAARLASFELMEAAEAALKALSLDPDDLQAKQVIVMLQAMVEKA
jgi:tetratricopeptide (TPR) repeat protein